MCERVSAAEKRAPQRCSQQGCSQTVILSFQGAFHGSKAIVTGAFSFALFSTRYVNTASLTRTIGTFGALSTTRSKPIHKLDGARTQCKTRYNISVQSLHPPHTHTPHTHTTLHQSQHLIGPRPPFRASSIRWVITRKATVSTFHHPSLTIACRKRITSATRPVTAAEEARCLDQVDAIMRAQKVLNNNVNLVRCIPPPRLAPVRKRGGTSPPSSSSPSRQLPACISLVSSDAAVCDADWAWSIG